MAQGAVEEGVVKRGATLGTQRSGECDREEKATKGEIPMAQGEGDAESDTEQDSIKRDHAARARTHQVSGQHRPVRHSA